MTDQDKKELAELMHKATPWGRINLASIIQSLMAVLLIWVAGSFSDLLEANSTQKIILSTMQENLTQMKMEISSLKSESRMTPGEFQKYLQPLSDKLEKIQENQTELKVRVGNSESAVYQIQRQIENKRLIQK